MTNLGQPKSAFPSQVAAMEVVQSGRTFELQTARSNWAI